MIVFSIAVPADLAPETLDWLRRMFQYMRDVLVSKGFEPIAKEIEEGKGNG